MSLIPLLFDDPFEYHYHQHQRPSRILDQQFGLGLSADDLLAPFTLSRGLTRCPAGYIRPWRTLSAEADAGSTIQVDKDKFQANLDVQQFKPEEIQVKVTGDREITVEGNHEEKQDEHGFISRHFLRRYVMPKECDIGRVESKLSSDGVLTITAPRTDQKQIEQRSIPVTQTGKPSKPIEQKNQQNGKQ